MDTKRTRSCFGALLFWLGAFIVFGLFSIPFPCEAQEIYRDKNGYFQFSPPPGWLQKGSAGGKKSVAKFTSPDGKVSLRVNVRPARSSEKNWQKLLADKKTAQDKIKKEFPKANVSLHETTLGGIKCIKIITEIPGSHVQANYVYVKNGLHFNLSYAARRQQDIDQYKQAALASFQTLQPGK